MFSRFVKILMDLAARSASVKGAMVAATLIALTTVFSGFTLDDYYHLATLDGVGHGATPLDLFVFGTGTPDQTHALMEKGMYPWYTLPGLKIHFFRPLSSALFSLDYYLFGRHAAFHHLHSLIWFALLAWGVALLYRHALPAPIAGLAILLYLLDDGHLGPVQWLSNRNALVSAAPALLGFAAHIRWREAGWRPGLPLSLLGYAIGFLGGETTLGISGFLFAYEMIGRRDALWLRVRALAPAGLLCVLYLAAYKLGGYGVTGSGVYLDPIGDPGGFLTEVPSRLLDLTGVQFFKLPVEVTFLASLGKMALLLRAATVAGALIVIYVARKVWSGMGPDERRNLAWLCAGSVIAALPGLAAYPSGRLMTLPSIGAFALIACFIHQCSGAAWASVPRVQRVAAGMLVFLHAIYTPIVWITRGFAVPGLAILSAGAFQVSDLDDQTLADKTVINFCAGDMYTGFYSMVMRREMGLAQTRSWQTLSQAPFDHEVTRTGENRFEVRVVGGEMLSLPVEQFFRSAQYPLAVGQVVKLDNYQVEVLEMGAWGPTRIGLTFGQSLDAPDLQFLAWQKGELRSFAWPPVGVPVILSPREGYFAEPYVRKHMQEAFNRLVAQWRGVESTRNEGRLTTNETPSRTTTESGRAPDATGSPQ